MDKKELKINKKKFKKNYPQVDNLRLALNRLALNNSTITRESLNSLLNGNGRDYNTACGYPVKITPQMYKLMYDREEIAAKIVDLWPNHTWNVLPDIYESEKEKITPFENAFDILQKKHKLFNMWKRVDKLSGIGSFGVMILGLNDGKSMSVPVEKGKKYELSFIKCADESVIKINSYELNTQSPRYGLPLMYSVTYVGQEDENELKDLQSKEIHYTRIIHIADNLQASNLFGKPRMKGHYNRLLDLIKLAGGSAEMFWQGGFPGMSFETMPDLAGNVTIDKASIEDELLEYTNGLKRYLMMDGVTAKSLAPQVADPQYHFELQMKMIAAGMDVPFRIFMGSEEAQLASEQDSKNWNKRVMQRQVMYVIPHIINPTIDRFIALGILPPAEYVSEWPDLTASTDKEIADVAVSKTSAIGNYVTSGASQLLDEFSFLTLIMKFSDDEARMIIATKKTEIGEEDEDLPPSDLNDDEEGDDDGEDSDGDDDDEVEE